MFSIVSTYVIFIISRKFLGLRRKSQREAVHMCVVHESRRVSFKMHRDADTKG